MFDELLHFVDYGKHTSSDLSPYDALFISMLKVLSHIVLQEEMFRTVGFLLADNIHNSAIAEDQPYC